MGTTWSLRIVAPPANAAGLVQSALDRVVAQMSQWDPDSDLSRFNRAAPGHWRMLPPELIEVLRAARDIGEASYGAFDPAMGAPADLWGFGPSGRREMRPDDAEIEAAMAGRVELDTLGLRACRHGAAQLDLSGIAKGYGVDRAAEALLAAGVRHFLVEVGGELRGHGVKPDGHPWWVDMELPPGVTLPPLRAALHDLSVATSGDYRRWFEQDGVRYAHSLDPRTGRPVTNGVRSVAVLHPRCMLADAWATALTVLGREGMAVADANGIAAYIVCGRDELLSAAFAAMLD